MALMDACDAQAAAAQADFQQQKQSLEADLAEQKELNAELSSQLRGHANTEDERAQTWKNHEAMLMFELSGARKQQELAELKNSETERKLEIVIKEAETMRRVFEASLKEA